MVYKLLTPDVRGAIEFCLMEIPAGMSTSEKMHNHEGEETAYIMSGETDIFLGEKKYHLREEDGVRIPPAMPHKWVDTSKEIVKVVFAVTPSAF